MTALTRAREATLQQDLKTMRKLIDDYYGDKGAFPALAPGACDAGLSPGNSPRSGQCATRRSGKRCLAKEGGISDVHSLSEEKGSNGIPYSKW